MYLHHQSQVDAPPLDGGASTTSGRSSTSSALRLISCPAWLRGECAQTRHRQALRTSPPDCVPRYHRRSSATPPPRPPYQESASKAWLRPTPSGWDIWKGYQGRHRSLQWWKISSLDNSA